MLRVRNSDDQSQKGFHPLLSIKQPQHSFSTAGESKLRPGSCVGEQSSGLSIVESQGAGLSPVSGLLIMWLHTTNFRLYTSISLTLASDAQTILPYNIKKIYTFMGMFKICIPSGQDNYHLN